MHGYGVMKYKNGEKYEGEWNDGFQTGLGMYRELNGNMEEYEYKWIICEKYYRGIVFGGEGAIIYADGNPKRGKFVSDHYSGYHFVDDLNKKVSNNKKIEILIKKATKESKKKLKHKMDKIKENKMVLSVEFLAGVDNNFKVLYKEGEIYIGQFGKDGLRKGKGIMKYNNGGIYNGNWKDDKLDGKGKYIFRDGSSYEGEFCKGSREGWGKMTCKNGDVYEGNWMKDKITGPRIFKCKGNWKIGNFVNGHLTGKGVILNEDGDIKEEGIFKNNVLNEEKIVSDDSEIKELIKMTRGKIKKEKNKINNLNDAGNNKDINTFVTFIK